MQDVYAVLHRVSVVVDFRGKVGQKVVVVLSGKRHEFSCREEARVVAASFLGVHELASDSKYTLFMSKAMPAEKKDSKVENGMEEHVVRHAGRQFVYGFAWQGRLT